MFPSVFASSVKFLSAVLILLIGATPALGQQNQRRPIPYPVSPPNAFEHAIDQGTRTATGEPGPNYWTNEAEYKLDAVLSPATKTLRGEAQIQYTNNSPDTLQRLVVFLRQNLHQEGAIRNRSVQITGGFDLSRVRIRGEEFLEKAAEASGPGYHISGTVMYVDLETPVAPNTSIDLGFAWNFEVPKSGAPRMGHENGNVYFLGYWYPQLAVYDDVQGWDTDPYMGDGEFYMGYADYEMDITVPSGWIVASTGQLTNPDTVLQPDIQKRIDQVRRGGSDVIAIVEQDERNSGDVTRTPESGRLTWSFSAENVRDVAFSVSNQYVWDATRAAVGDRDGDGRTDSTMIHALYRPEASIWKRSAEFTRFSVEDLSDMLIPYPYPHMTSVEGVVGGGMEYPMITIIGRYGAAESVFSTTYHEVSHMWIPMYVGTQETDYTWMDEGLTSFNTNDGLNAFFDDLSAWDPNRQYYYYTAGTSQDFPIMRHADRYPVQGPARVVASYNKPGVAFHALRGVLGEETFFEAYRTFLKRWTNKHPYPYDLFNTFEDVAERELDWFWTSLFYETWTLDHAVTDLDQSGSQPRITITDKGRVPMPVFLQVTYADGRTHSETIPVDHWLQGERDTTVTVPAGTVERVRLDPEQYLPDVARGNNTLTVDE